MISLICGIKIKIIESEYRRVISSGGGVWKMEGGGQSVQTFY